VAGLTTFCIVLAGTAVATCALSYPGIRAIAQQGGIQAHYARDYPLLIDAILVIVLAAVLALRGAGLPSRMLSWLTLLVLLVAVAGAEALHATGRRMPRDTVAITVAVLPWLLVLVTFVLLLAMLRHARLRQLSMAAPARPEPADPEVRARAGRRQPLAPSAPLPVRTPQPWDSASIVPSVSSRLISAAAAGAAAGRAAAPDGPGLPGGSVTAARHEPADPGGDQPEGTGADHGSADPLVRPGRRARWRLRRSPHRDR